MIYKTAEVVSPPPALNMIRESKNISHTKDASLTKIRTFIGLTKEAAAFGNEKKAKKKLAVITQHS